MQKLTKHMLIAGIIALGAFVSIASPSLASGTITVTPANTQGWSTADTRTGGSVDFVTDTTSPLPDGALQLTTDSTTAAKAQYMHAATEGTVLSNVTELSYATKQVSGPAVADPSYQLPVNLTGTGGFTTLVYEPYYNGTVVPGEWQTWNAAQGLWWSSRTVNCSNGTIVGSAGGPATYTLSQISTICPEAVVLAFGVNVGTYNPSYVVETDAVDFNGTTYDFQNTPASKDECKNGGWEKFVSMFKNQGDCVSYVQSNANAIGNKTK